MPLSANRKPKISLSKISPSKPQVYSANDLKALLGDKQTILKYKKLEKIRSLASGFYCTQVTSDFDARVLVVAQYYPQAVISGRAALKLHGFLESDNGTVEADIDRDTNLKNNLIRFRRVTKHKLVGVKETKVHGKIVRVYDVERSLAELYHLDLSPQELIRCWQKYISDHDVRVDRLTEYGDVVGVDLVAQLNHHLMHKEYLPKKQTSEDDDIDYRMQIIEAAINVFCERGSTGTSIELVAQESGLSSTTVLRLFKSKKALLLEVHNALENKFLANLPPPLFSPDMSPEKAVRTLTEAALKMVEVDPISFRIQRWTTAEESPYSQKVIKTLVSGIIRTLKMQITKKVPDISSAEAEARASLLAASYDHYLITYWYYVRFLEVEFTREQYLENYKRGILTNLIDMCFSPAKWTT